MPHLGRWEVVELTGSISAVETGPAPPDGICAPFSGTHEPVLDSVDTWVALSPLREGALWDADWSDANTARVFEELRDEGFQISIALFNAGLDAGLADPDASFIFSFAFENGYLSNRALEGLGSVHLEVEQRATTVRYGGVFRRESGSVGGLANAVISGTAQGESVFTVTGEWQAPDRLSGEWAYVEVARLAGCALFSQGSGEWAAVAP